MHYFGWILAEQETFSHWVVPLIHDLSPQKNIRFELQHPNLVFKKTSDICNIFEIIWMDFVNFTMGTNMGAGPPWPLFIVLGERAPMLVSLLFKFFLWGGSWVKPLSGHHIKLKKS